VPRLLLPLQEEVTSPPEEDWPGFIYLLLLKKQQSKQQRHEGEKERSQGKVLVKEAASAFISKILIDEHLGQRSLTEMFVELHWLKRAIMFS